MAKKANARRRPPRQIGAFATRVARSRRNTQETRDCSLEEKIDTSSAAGELEFHVFGAIAQFERRLIAERTRDGMNAARAKGSKPGRPRSIRRS
jgi:Resolvase, N terminal domain